MYRVTEEKESQILSTPSPGPDNLMLLESSIMRETTSKADEGDFSNGKKNNLNNLVTKIDPFPSFPTQPGYQNQPQINDPTFYEQGQNNYEPYQEHLHHTTSTPYEQDERRITKYIEKDTSQLSMTKSDQSQLSNLHQDSPGLIDEDEHQSELHKAHLIQTLQAIQYIKTLPQTHSLDDKYVNLPPNLKFTAPETTKTIIFDLDETLVHCVDDPDTDNPHVILKVKFPSGEAVDAGINIRPYAIECLKEANKYFQVVVFTASHQSYADVVLDYLDPNHDLIQYRLYRDSCVQTPEGVYIKDLRIIKNRILENMVIVDNAVYSFGFQLDNGIPIIPFYDDPNDEELHHLVFYMK